MSSPVISIPGEELTTTPGQPLLLVGSPFERGRLQAILRPEKADAVRAAVHGRLASVRRARSHPEVKAYLASQRRFAHVHCGPEMAELEGIATGFEIPSEELFAYLHLGILLDLVANEGCTAWAMRWGHGALLAKNRDFRGEHRDLQEVFLHRGPDPQALPYLAVGSLGSPGAFSSGINAAWLALADTAIDTTRHRTGWLRYFLMTRLLRTCRTVGAARALIADIPHAGGGSLVMADATGGAMVVEFGVDDPCVEAGERLARTNHFLRASGGRSAPDDPRAQSSTQRFATIQGFLQGSHNVSLEQAAARMASHAEGEHEGLCRHGEDGDTLTISTSLYVTDPPALHFAPGNPCSSTWKRYSPAAAE
jgi:isopenicillin-N N-acyltransferase like protein